MTKKISSPATPILWNVEDMPQQRINAVRELPPEPENLNFESVFLWPHEAHGLKPKRRLHYLGGVEWAWSPAHNRIDHYYLFSSKKYWMLWNHLLVHWEDPWSWEWHLYSICKRTYKTDPKTIAIHLLKTQWETDYKDDGIDHYHFVASTDYFDVEDFQMIGRAVWN